MTVDYSINEDPRFNVDYANNYVNLLDTHGFPLVDEQEKDVHKLGRSLGLEVDELQSSVKEIFQQTKILTAEGNQIDAFMNQFNVFRGFGETDDQFKKRSLSLLFPKKITQPFILETLREILKDDENLPTIISPWRSVIDYDSLKDTSTYDVGDGYIWSPDYWRSGVIVFRTELDETINSYVRDLIALGIHPIFEQFDYSTTEIDVGQSHYQNQENYNIEDFNGSYFDVVTSDYDDVAHNYDSTDFVNNPFYRQQSNYNSLSIDVTDFIDYSHSFNYETIEIEINEDDDLIKLYETFINDEFLKFAETFSLTFNGLDFSDEFLKFLETVSAVVDYNTTLEDEPDASDNTILGYTDGTIVDLFLDYKTKHLSSYSIRKVLSSYAGDCAIVNGESIGFENNVLDYEPLLGLSDGFVSRLYDQSTSALNLNPVGAGAQIVNDGDIIGDDTLAPFFDISNDSYILPSSNWLSNDSATFVFALEFNTLEDFQLLEVPDLLELKTTATGRLEIKWLGETFSTLDDKVAEDQFNTIAFTINFKSKTVSMFVNGVRVITDSVTSLIKPTTNKTFEVFNNFSGGLYDFFVFRDCNDFYVESLMTDIHIFWNKGLIPVEVDDDFVYLKDEEGNQLTDHEGNILIEGYPNPILTEDGHLIITEDFNIILYD